jgi:hypothetical protein
MELTNEQKEILKHASTHNLMIDSVAGSGKTTTLLHLVKLLDTKRILLLTYNRRLRIETKERVDKMGITNVEVRTYHGFGCAYFSTECCRDFGIQEVLNKNVQPCRKIDFDYIIIDECQDLTHLYYQFVIYFLQYNSSECMFALIGDKNQNIYGYNNADARFLTMGPDLFHSEYPWIYLHLSVTFRVPSKIVEFINKCVLGQNRLIAHSEGGSVSYYMTDEKEIAKVIYEKCKTYGCENVFVLASTIYKMQSCKDFRDRKQIARIANILSQQGIPVFVPLSDFGEIGTEISKGKVIFSSFHQTKGLERDCVIVLRLDDKNKSVQGDVVPNTVYVALTRAKKELIIFHEDGADYVEYFTPEGIETYCEKYELHEAKTKSRKPNQYDFSDSLDYKITDYNKGNPLTVTDLIRHLPSDITYELVNMLKYTIKLGEKIKINPIAQGKMDLKEHVSDINGMATTCLFELKLTESVGLFPDEKFETTADLLRKIVYYQCQSTGFYVRKNQIKSYNWLGKKTVDAITNRLEEHCGTKNLVFEDGHTLQLTAFQRAGRAISGRVDIVNKVDKVLWEIKCVQSIDKVHIIQLAIYALMFPEMEHYYLLNVCGGEFVELFFDKKDSMAMLHKLIKHKYYSNNEISDEEFITLVTDKKNKIIDDLADSFAKLKAVEDAQNELDDELFG